MPVNYQCFDLYLISYFSVKLFVGGLSWQTEEEQLQKYFCQFGTIDNVQIMRDPFTLVSEYILIMIFSFVIHSFIIILTSRGVVIIIRC